MAVAEKLAACWKPGTVIALYGGLGAGKSVFCRGAARYFGVPEREVRSPTFTLLNIYRSGEIQINHFDLYRIDDPDELFFLGFEDHIYSNAISLIEWAERIEDELPPETVRIFLDEDGGDKRTITVKGMRC